MDNPRGLLAPRSLWSTTGGKRQCLGFHIPDEIFAVFFILVILSLAKDEDVQRKMQENRSVQIAILILAIYCFYNRIPWSLAFILTFIIAVSFTNLLSDAKGTFLNIMAGLRAMAVKKEAVEEEKDDGLMRMGARVLKMADGKLKGILKKPEKKVSFDDESESESDSDDEMCGKVSRMFGLDPESEAETTDNETEEEQEKRKDDLRSFLLNEEKNVSKS